MIKFFLLFFMLIISLTNYPQSFFVYEQVKAFVEQLTLEQKIGQLFMPRVCLQQGEEHLETIEHLITEHHIGGLLVLNGGVLLTNERSKAIIEQQITILNRLQKKATIPLLVGQDLEWGLTMRLADGIRFAKAMTLGAIQNNDLIYELGKEIGRQTRLIGVHINFAPVVDINTNPYNPVINDRSFGDDKEQVTQKAYAFMCGLHESNVLSCLKHFPGHGDTRVDSHLDLPTIHHDRQRLEAIELYPYKQLYSYTPMIMMAHLYVPALVEREKVPSSLSGNIITELLRHKLGFDGLIITDGLRMKAVSTRFCPEEIALKAFLAGNDIILDLEDTIAGISAIKQALEDGVITEEEIDRRVIKIIAAKKWVGLFEHKLVDEYDHELICSSQAYDLKRELYTQAITLVKDEQYLIPFDQHQVAVVQIGGTHESSFVNTIRSSCDDVYYGYVTDHITEALMQQLKKYDVVIIGLFGMNKYAHQQFGISDQVIHFINELSTIKKVMLTIFGSPYSLALFDLKNIVMAYEDDVDAQIAAAHVILGKQQAIGKLPVSIFL